MAVGKSGRIVIEIDPETKQEIHDKVKSRGLNLREWFLQQAQKDLDVASPEGEAAQRNKNK